MVSSSSLIHGISYQEDFVIDSVIFSLLWCRCYFSTLDEFLYDFGDIYLRVKWFCCFTSIISLSIRWKTIKCFSVVIFYDVILIVWEWNNNTIYQAVLQRKKPRNQNNHWENCRRTKFRHLDVLDSLSYIKWCAINQWPLKFYNVLNCGLN